MTTTGMTPKSSSALAPSGPLDARAPNAGDDVSCRFVDGSLLPL